VKRGVLVPPGFTATDEPSASRTECLLDGGESLHARSWFLQIQEHGDDAAEREVVADWTIEDLLAGERVHDAVFPGARPLRVRQRASAERLPGPYGPVRLRLLLENASDWTGEERAEALRHSLVAAHTLITVNGGAFVSPADPPEWARPAVDACENLHTWPVLIEDHVVLSSASHRPRSDGDLGAGASVSPETDGVTIGGRRVARGGKVRLRPAGRADAQDMFLAGRLAHVEAVLNDVDGQTHLAVALDDLVEDGVNPHGRFLYFAPDEVEPL
jgi:hypothetical protein